MITRFLILLLFGCLVPSAGAVGEESAKGISIRLFAVALLKDQGPVCVMTGKSRGDVFEIPTTNLSDPQSVTAREFILISAATPVESAPVPLSTIRLPEQGTDFRIILVPTEKAIYKPVVIRGDDPKFAPGDFYFINLSSHQMLGTLGSSRINMKPGAQEMVRPAGAKSDKQFEVKFARREGDKLRPLTDTCWPIIHDNRSFVIFYDGKGGRPTYRAVDEFMALPVTQ